MRATINVALSADARAALEREAARRGVTLSDVARERLTAEIVE